MSSEDRYLLLERRLRHTQASVACLVAVIAVGLVVNRSSAAPPSDNRVIHARAVIIEDEQGRPRILLGAPTPTVAGRLRNEAVNGMVLLGPNCADHIVVSYPGYEPQVMGKVVKRGVVMPSAGFMINDAEGNERAGLGSSDDGTRVALGMDYSDRDAVGLLVSPNFSGFAAFARNGGRNDQAVLAVTKDGTSMFKLADPNGDEGVIVEDRKESGLKVQMLNPSTRKLQDVVLPVAH